MGTSRFEELEERVNQLLKGWEDLEVENRALRASLEGKEMELRELIGKVKQFDREKVQVRDRVDTLLTRLDTLIEKP
jgi:uncharacterized protein (TIGR02449 family)